MKRAGISPRALRIWPHALHIRACTAGEPGRQIRGARRLRAHTQSARARYRNRARLIAQESASGGVMRGGRSSGNVWWRGWIAPEAAPKRSVSAPVSRRTAGGSHQESLFTGGDNTGTSGDGRPSLQLGPEQGSFRREESCDASPSTAPAAASASRRDTENRNDPPLADVTPCSQPARASDGAVVSTARGRRYATASLHCIRLAERETI
jgi:hypothetical protein